MAYRVKIRKKVAAAEMNAEGGWVGEVPAGLSSWCREDFKARSLLTTKAGGPKWAAVRFRTTFDVHQTIFLEDAVPVVGMTKKDVHKSLGRPIHLRTTLW